jgi:hypothetical protein
MPHQFRLSPQPEKTPRNLEAEFGSAHSETETLLSEDSRKLLAAWKAWRGAAAAEKRLLPHRRDMDLVSIARLMPKLALLDVFGPQRMVFRLAGTDIEAVTGMRLRGRDHIAMAHPDQRAARSRLLWGAATQPCGALTFHSYQHPDTGMMQQIETFVLPILPDDAQGNPRAPIQLIGIAAHLPMLEQGSHVTRPLEHAGAMQHFIDIGAGIPA